MTAQSTKANAVLIQALGSGIRSTSNGLADVPALLTRVLEEEAWRVFTTPRGELVEHSRFIDFVTTPPTAGLGASIDLVRRIVAEDQVARDLFDRALQDTQVPGERTDLLDNVQQVRTKAPSGNRQEAALRRLRKDAPELHARVMNGELSAHAAMVQAGFRAKTVTVPTGRPESCARALKKNMNEEDIKALIKLLTAS
ncbi:hypothetical protein [Streptomyces cyaneofuscatus]|uniref:hypothetical protein n=1 Tax=Streptomyces cyaneofuscatus TaxID=66883 RepID=UPI0038307F1C